MITALASLSLLLAATPATNQTVPTARVQVSDLNLHSAAGRAELDRRLDRAAAAVCSSGNGIRDLRRIRQAQACRVEAIAAAADQRRAALASANAAPAKIASNGR